MIDDAYKVWLIEVNTNPWLELSWGELARIIPEMLENAFKIALDPIFCEPNQQNSRKAATEFPENKFELVYSSAAKETP